MISEKLAESLWDLHLRQPILSTLLCRLDCNCLPLGLLGSGGFVSQTNDGPIGNNRGYFRGSNLHRFLDDQVHVFSFRNRLTESDLATQRRSLGFMKFAEPDF